MSRPAHVTSVKHCSAGCPCRIVALDLNGRGLKLRNARPGLSSAMPWNCRLPMMTFDVVMASLFFHHLSNDGCVRVLSEMWRIARRRVLVNDLHRHSFAYFSIRALDDAVQQEPYGPA